MNIGQGSVIRNSKIDTSAKPPFTSNSANNGLSVDAVTGKIVLGDDVGGILSTLLSNRQIPLDGFLITLLGLFGLIQFSDSTIGIQGDETNGFPATINFSDTGADQGGVEFLKSVAAMLVFMRDAIGGDHTGFSIRRHFVQVCNEVFAPPVSTGAQFQVQNDISTGDPNSGIGKWFLGKVQAGAVALDATQYVEVKIDGAIVKLGIVT